MTAPKLLAAVVGVICGLELIAAIAIGGAGLSAAFGWNGLIVTLAALAIAVGSITRKRSRRRLGWSRSGGETRREA